MKMEPLSSTKEKSKKENPRYFEVMLIDRILCATLLAFGMNIFFYAFFSQAFSDPYFIPSSSFLAKQPILSHLFYSLLALWVIRIILVRRCQRKRV